MLFQLQLLLVIFLGVSSCSLDSKGDSSFNKKRDFKQLLTDIREQTISPQDAEEEFKRIMADLLKKYKPKMYDSLAVDLVFPLKGRNYRDVGGKGRGFYGRHFDLFDHSVAKSHPAHDIFIYDLDRDCKDDNTGEYVDVLAVNDGVIIATETEWSETNGYKGGNYVWLYDLTTGGLWYYAHQRKVYVVKDQLVKQGDKLGEVGRSGFNAGKGRSDTHLHLMFLKVNEVTHEPTPVNHYLWLKNARTVHKTQLPEHYPRVTLEATELTPKAPFTLVTNFVRRIF